jgi:hypothetical protein
MVDPSMNSKRTEPLVEPTSIDEHHQPLVRPMNITQVIHSSPTVSPPGLGQDTRDDDGVQLPQCKSDTVLSVHGTGGGLTLPLAPRVTV